MRQECAACGQRYALTFRHCPVCNAPAGSKRRAAPVHAPAAAPVVESKPEAAPAPAPAANFAIPDLDLAPLRTVRPDSDALEPRAPVAFEPPVAPEPVESPRQAPRASSPPAQVPDGGFDLGSEHSDGAFDLGSAHSDASGLELGSAHDDGGALDLGSTQGGGLDLEAAPDGKLDLETAPDGSLEPGAHTPMSEPAPSLGEAGWKNAAQSASSFAAAPSPSPVSTPRAFVPPPIRVAYRSSAWSAVPALLLWLGVLCFAVGGLMFGVAYAFKRVKKLEIAELRSMETSTDVELLDGVANWTQATTIDLASPIPLGSSEELTRRGSELRGRLVSLPATPIATFLHKQYRIDRNGQREEIPGLSRAYCPVSLGNSTWVVSMPIQNATFQHPEVGRFEDSRVYVGVVQRLDQLVSLEMIRDSEVTGGEDSAPSGKIQVPDDAIAIVTVPPSADQKKYSAATIAGTQGRYLAVTVEDRPSSDQNLRGRFHPCPSKTCEDFALALGTEPAGVLMIARQEDTSSQTIQLAIVFLFGIACIGASVIVKRKLD